ncbi:MAG: AAA domain-containing protein [Planctomycetota bacterium]
MADPDPTRYPILQKMLDRLYVSLMRGPGLNCRPHSSRQRIDLTDLESFDDGPPTEVLRALLGDDASANISAKVPMPEGYNAGGWNKRRTKPKPAPLTPEAETPAESAGDSSATPTPETQPPAQPETEPEEEPESAEVRAYRRQRSLLAKLRNLSDDAKTYEQDTGVHALNVGYPILSVPPGVGGGTRRILAPIAFVPVSLKVKAGGRPGIELACRGEGEDRIKPNPALMAWLERETGRALPDDMFGDDEGAEPWKEVAELVRVVAEMLEMPPLNRPELSEPEGLTLDSVPRADDLPAEAAVIGGAVLGLFPASNQGLLRDTREMIKQPKLEGPVASFVEAGVSLTENAEPVEVPEAGSSSPLGGESAAPMEPAAKRFVARADPCQGRAVMLARESTGLVLHGPPGTGKSQTITNIIGDHLARGQRVLFVCDKRTALDVVAHRLAALGLDGLCALVHDAQRDQRNLYMGIRAQLEQLPDTKTHPRAAGRVEKIDREFDQIHAELDALHRAIMEPPDGDTDGESFHQLMGRWQSLSAPSLPDESLRCVGIDDLEEHRAAVQVVLERGATISYAENAWAGCAGSTLDDYLARRNDEVRQQLASCVEDARATDAAGHESIPPFGAEEALAEQATRRGELLKLLEDIDPTADPAAASGVAALDEDDVSRRMTTLDSEVELRRTLDEPLDNELWLIVKDDLPGHRAVAEQLGALEQYLQSARKWWGFLAIGAKKQAAAVLRGYGQPRTVDAAERVRGFLVGLRGRVALTLTAQRLADAEIDGGVMPDAALREVFGVYEVLLRARQIANADTDLAESTKAALTDGRAMESLRDGLTRSAARAETLEQLERSMTGLRLFEEDWLRGVRAQCRRGSAVTPLLLKLQDGFDDLESVLRINDGLAGLPEGYRPALRALLEHAVDPEMGMNALLKRVLAHTLSQRVAADPKLARLDPEAIEHAFARHGELEEQKRGLVVDLILDHWKSKQKKRLLSATGTRKNALGASLQQRLFVRGKRAMRLRQVIHLGMNTTYDDGGGDPLFDMAPVWLASPETVAQVFPREQLFDVVIFDEASQCRLEEALPVLTRAKRVVIAGDPKQLPPTRFFEASIAQSDDTPIETEDDLFEAQQSEVEDLLAGALNLDVQESYLDVHYRSRNADLIEFSNQQFYNDRLQAIPGHPRNRTRYAPVTLHRVVDPLYEDRVNEPEAREVVRIVDELLRRAEPPSIGVACFNLAQRDLIAELLDDKAMEDDDFARRLAQARTREGDDSFEGLFVKNLENVQGDERDHIVISTTYGPTAAGKFYRRFGPLAMPGGGRRLNVLVTRARQEVHLVTSIPADVYRSFERPPEGATPSGSWLLFAYLRYAETLDEAYEQNHRVLEQAAAAEAQAFVRRTRNPSRWASAVAGRLARKHSVASDVHWGNDGFCVDLALHHPTRAEDVTVGVMCDFSRFDLAPDAVEWDIYRCGILRWQGWELERLWSPTFFRDPTRALNQVIQASDREAATYAPPAGETP